VLAAGSTRPEALRHLILLLDELAAIGIGFATLGESIDTTTPAGRLQLHVLSAISQFEGRTDLVAARPRG